MIMINGSPTPIFKARKGLRQGDPLSPLLFVLGMEYLSRLLKIVQGSFNFHPRCKTIKLSHLCFADDLMLFCKGDILSVQVLCKCLDIFAHTSNLQANSSKFALYTTGVPIDIQREMITVC